MAEEREIGQRLAESRANSWERWHEYDNEEGRRPEIPEIPAIFND